MAKLKVFLSEKEEQILSTIKESKEKLTLTELSNSIKSSLPYTSHLVTMLEVKNLVKIQRKDKRSKYVLLTTEEERKPPETVKYKENPQTINLALKLISFFLSHAGQMKGDLSNKLIESFTDKDREFIEQYQSRIEELEVSWEL